MQTLQVVGVERMMTQEWKQRMGRCNTCGKDPPHCAEAACLRTGCWGAAFPGLPIHIYPHPRRNRPAGYAQLQRNLCRIPALAASYARGFQGRKGDVGCCSGALEEAGLKLDAEANSWGGKSGRGELVDVELEHTTVHWWLPA